MFFVVRPDNCVDATSVQATKPSEFATPPFVTVATIDTRHQSNPAVVMVGLTSKLVFGSTKKAIRFAYVGIVM